VAPSPPSATRHGKKLLPTSHYSVRRLAKRKKGEAESASTIPLTVRTAAMGATAEDHRLPLRTAGCDERTEGGRMEIALGFEECSRRVFVPP
jgi:hypothetical protein